MIVAGPTHSRFVEVFNTNFAPGQLIELEPATQTDNLTIKGVYGINPLGADNLPAKKPVTQIKVARVLPNSDGTNPAETLDPATIEATYPTVMYPVTDQLAPIPHKTDVLASDQSNCFIVAWGEVVV